MTRKFLFCFPLRVGNIVFGYIVIMTSVAVIIYHMYMLALCFISEDKNIEQKFHNWEMLEQLFGQRKDSLVVTITLLYHTSYIVIGLLLMIFTSIFLCGIAKANQCLVSSFFVYCFLHMFLTVCLVVWEATSAGYVQLGLVLLSDVLLVFCLFGVKYLMESIRTGFIYNQPDDFP